MRNIVQPVVAALVLLLAVSSCKDDEDKVQPNALVGEWTRKTVMTTRYDAQNQVTSQTTRTQPPGATIIYRADGTFRSENPGSGAIEGTYVRTGNEIVFTFLYNGVQNTSREVILSFTANQLDTRSEVQIFSEREVHELHYER